MSKGIDSAIQKLQQETNHITIADLDEGLLLRLLSKLDPEQLKSREITEADANRLARQLCNLKHGVLANTPMLCAGADCPQKDECSLFALGIHPLGDPCPWETLIVENLTGSMIKELVIDPNNASEMSILSDLIQAEIMDMRATHQIAKVGLTQEQPIAVDNRGNVIYKEEEAVVFQIQEKLKNRKDKLRRRLLVDRESKAKTKVTNPTTLADTLSALVTRLQSKATEADIAKDANYEEVDDNAGD
jgi:hypothetical protein